MTVQPSGFSPLESTRLKHPVPVNNDVSGIAGRPDECIFGGVHQRLLEAPTPLSAALTPTSTIYI